MGKQVKIGELDLGTEVRFGGMIWIVKRKSQECETVTLALKESIKRMEFDAAEPGNPDKWVSDYGSNSYELSNIRQWLNSSGSDWFRKQHDHDAAPGYAGIKGFRSQFSKKEIKQITPKETVAGHFPDFFYLPAAEEKDLVNGEEFDDEWVWTRTPSAANSRNARIADSSGALYSGLACNGSYGVRPLCDLKSETKLKKVNGTWEARKRKEKKMTTANKQSKHEDILTGVMLKYGFEAQTMMAIEKMSGLTKEISKMKRGHFGKVRVLEEMADVQIMLWQLAIIFGEPEEWVNKKMMRLEEMVQE